jgi:hypothetical protein
MIQCAGSLRFVGESSPSDGIGAGVGQHLDRDVAVQARVAGTIHLTHAPGT